MRWALLIGALILSSIANAQTLPISSGFEAQSAGTTTLSASTTSSRAAVAAAPTAWVENHGVVPVCVAWGDSTVVASYPCSSPIAPGQVGTFAIRGAADIAAVTSSSIASLAITTGNLQFASSGPAPFPFPGSPYALYSTAKVNLNATKSFQAIRASDSATLDIGFVGGNADVASFTSFCAGTTCQAKLYDQSGNGRDCISDGVHSLPMAIAANGRIWFSLVDSRPTLCVTAGAFTSNGDQTIGMGGVVLGTDLSSQPFGNFDGTNGFFLTYNGGGGGGIGPHPGVASYFATTEYITSTNLLSQQNSIAFTRSSGTVTPYINKVAGTPTAGFSNSNASVGASIGSFPSSFSLNFVTAGLFSEAYYYTSALTPTQMASIQAHEASFWPDLGFGTPATGSASVQFSNFTTFSTGEENIALGNVLDYEYTQPWSVLVSAQIYGVPPTDEGGILFTNVPDSRVTPGFPGYEFWIDELCHLRVRLINNITTHLVGVEGTTQVCDLKKHVFAATYDGSGTAAGVKMYIDGQPETTIVEADTLGGNSIVAPGQSYLIGNQQGLQFNLPGTMNVFRQDNVVRNAAYMLSHNTASSLLTGDANTAVLLPLNNAADGTTVNDTSGNGHNGTLTDASMWVH